MSTKPTLILIPGSWHTAAVWDKVSNLLEAQGYVCIAVDLPSNSPNPSATFYDDVQAVRKAILSETSNKNNDVVLVAWSYGGQVANSAIKGLTSTATIDEEAQEEEEEEKASHHGHVLGISLIASGFTATGVSFLTTIPPPFITLNHTTGYAELTIDPKALFYNDLAEREAQHWESNLTTLSLKALAEGGEHAYAGWKDVPVWFLVPLDDAAFPAGIQKDLIRSAIEQGGDVTMREVKAGHAALLSRPGEVAEFVREAVEAFVVAGT